MASRAWSIFTSNSLFPMILHTDLVFDSNWLSLMMVLTIFPSGAFDSLLASTKSKPVAHLYTVSLRWKFTILIICSSMLAAVKLK